jgi:SAM-dependent methyltransferase
MTTGIKIPTEERKWLPESFVDPNGRLFEWRGGLYRMLFPGYGTLWADLFKQGFAKQLIRDGLLVESEITDAEAEPGGLVIKHRRVPVTSYCFEWPPLMLQEAALVTLDLCIRLAERGLTLQDGHPWNILFDGPRPIFIDIGSIVPARDDVLWAPYQQFCNFFIYPLYLYSAGRDRLARSLLHEYVEGVTDHDVLAALPLSFKLRHPLRTLGISAPPFMAKIFEKLPREMQGTILSFSTKINRGMAGGTIRRNFFQSLRKKIEEIKFPSAKSHWASYYRTTNKNCFATDLSPAEWTAKQQVVARILKELSPKTVLDVGANTGRYACIAAAGEARVIACDLDVPAVDLCYREARQARLDLLPLVSNVFSLSPIPGRGGVACPPPTKRFRSEFVMGLAVIHHVVASQRFNIDRIVEIFDRLCSRWLLLEFVPPLNQRIGARPVALLDDYSSDSLEACLGRRFRSIARHSSYPEERLLFLCEK